MSAGSLLNAGIYRGSIHRGMVFQPELGIAAEQAHLTIATHGHKGIRKILLTLVKLEAKLLLAKFPDGSVGLDFKAMHFVFRMIDVLGPQFGYAGLACNLSGIEPKSDTFCL